MNKFRTGFYPYSTYVYCFDSSTGAPTGFKNRNLVTCTLQFDSCNQSADACSCDSYIEFEFWHKI